MRGITPDGLATVVNVEWYGSDAVELTYKEASGRDLGLLTNAVRSALRSKHDLMLENLALRQQLAVLTRQRARTRTKPADRLFWSGLSRYWPGWRSTLVMVQPETVIRWQPHGVARVLDVEEPSPTPGPAAYQQRAARAHREDRNREPAAGAPSASRASYSRSATR